MAFADEGGIWDFRSDVLRFKRFDYLGWLLDWKVLVAACILALSFAWLFWQLHSSKQKEHKDPKSSLLAVTKHVVTGDNSDPLPEEWHANTKWVSIVARFSSVFGVDLLILAGLQRDKVVVIIVVFFGILTRELILVLRLKCYGNRRKWCFHLLERAGMKNIDVAGTYQDFGVSFLRCVLVFTAQAMLMVYYLHDLAMPINLDSRAYRFWCSSILIQFMTKDQMNRDFHVEAAFWNYSLNEMHSDKMTLEHGVKSYSLPGRAEMWARCCFAKVSHACFLQIIIYTLPLQLMDSKTGLDFVKDTFAIVFIPGLDFYNEIKSYKIVHRSFRTA